jgi:hypothetical protein
MSDSLFDVGYSVGFDIGLNGDADSPLNQEIIEKYRGIRGFEQGLMSGMREGEKKRLQNQKEE